MMNIFKSNKGMTLMEIMVGMMLFAIVAAAVSVILVPLLKIYEQANELAEYNTLLDDIANQMIGDLLESTDEPIPNNIDGNPFLYITTDSPSDVVYTIDDDGVLCKVGTDNGLVPIFGKSYYKGKSVTFDLQKEGTSTKAYKLTVTISLDDGSGSVSRDYAVRPLALNQY